MNTCIVCKNNKTERLVCSECRDKDLSQSSSGECSTCMHRAIPRQDHPSVNDIGWIYCEKKEFDVADYLYCSEYKQEEE